MRDSRLKLRVECNDNTHSSTPKRNVNYLNQVSKLDVMNEPKYRLKEAMPYQNDETLEPWRISLLTKFLEIKINRSYNQFNVTYSQVNAMINSLCI